MNHETPPSALEQRVIQLEKQSRLLKALLLAIPFLTLMLGAEAAKKAAPTETLEAESLVIASPDGKGRATLSLVDGSPQLVLSDKDGQVRARLAADFQGRGPGLFLSNEQGDGIAMLHKHKKAGALVLYSDGDNPIVTVGEADASNGYGTINFYDDKGKWKQAIGGGNLK